MKISALIRGRVRELTFWHRIGVSLVLGIGFAALAVAQVGPVAFVVWGVVLLGLAEFIFNRAGARVYSAAVEDVLDLEDGDDDE